MGFTFNQFFRRGIRGSGGLVAGMLLAVAPVPRVSAAVIFVRADASGNADGQSWATAFPELQSALRIANPNDEIWVAQGVYRPDFDPLEGFHTGDPHMSFMLRPGVGIYGGFAGNENNRDQRNPQLHLTELSGDLLGNDGPSLRQFEICRQDAGVNTANSCQVYDYDDDSDVDNNDRQALLATRADNTHHILWAANGGGGAVIDGFLITAGTALQALGTSDDRGAGLLIQNGMADGPLVRGCRFRDNLASSAGAAVFAFGGSPTLSECQFEENRLLMPFGRGGAVAVAGGSAPVIANCRFRRNAGGIGGAVALIGSTAEMFNCILIENSATRHGGGVALLEQSNVTLSNVTITGNVAEDPFGGGGLFLLNSGASLINSILWADLGGGASEIYLLGGFIEVSNSLVGGGRERVLRNPLQPASIFWNENNLDVDPRLTPEGTLTGNSPCIDAGDSMKLPPDATDLDGDGDTLEALPWDIHGEDRRVSRSGTPGGNDPLPVDIGADEFVDVDQDLLPDYWERRYFGSPTAGLPNGDPDNDLINSLDEFARYGSNPVAPPVYVCNQCSPNPNGSSQNPFNSIQDGINAANDGDTVLLRAFQPTVYAGPGNTGLNLQGKSIVIRRTGLGAAIIDADGAGQAVYARSLRGAFPAIDGLTLRNGGAAVGGGLLIEGSRVLLSNVVLESNFASAGGALHIRSASPVLDNVRFTTGNSNPLMVIEDSNLRLSGPLTIPPGQVLIGSSSLTGQGAMVLSAGTEVQFGSPSGAPGSVLACDVIGPGSIFVPVKQALVISGQAAINLSGVQAGSCGGEPGPPLGAGPLISQGTLVLTDQASIQNSQVEVTNLRMGPDTAMVHCTLILNADDKGFVRPLAIDPTASIQCNLINSDAERYQGLDPDPLNRNLLVNSNKFFVAFSSLEEGGPDSVNELRVQDFDCTGICPSGAFPLAASTGYDDPWAVEELEVLPGANVNLTNRQGSVFQAPEIDTPEAMYVSTVILHPDATLNVGGQRIYYRSLVDENGNDIDPAFPHPNGSRIVDVPLLGFSLTVIAMDDQLEYDVRTMNRVVDPAQVQTCECLGQCENDSPPQDSTACAEGALTRLPNARGPGNGVMEMRTKLANRANTASVAAKGTFAKAADDRVLVAFEYLFRSDPNAELIVYLSDDPDVGDSLLEIGRIKPPATGRAGAIGSTDYGVFSIIVDRQWLDFTRGTYVELELRGTNASVYIDLWDPVITCFAGCGNYDAQLYSGGAVDQSDYLLLIAEMQQAVQDQDYECLDLTGDGYADLADALMWDAMYETSLNLCPEESSAVSVPAERTTGPLAPMGGNPPAHILLAGKLATPIWTMDGYVREDAIVRADATGGCLSVSVSPPAGGSGSGVNGRLVSGGNDLYQIQSVTGIVRLNGLDNSGDDELVLIPASKTHPTVATSTVHVGIVSGEDPSRPLADAVFDPGDANTLYVAPVVVETMSGDTYDAVAKVTLTGGGGFNLVAVYGGEDDPYSDVRMAYPREIELSPGGGYLFVATAYASAFDYSVVLNNDYILVYDVSAGGAPLSTFQTYSMSPVLNGPTALHASKTVQGGGNSYLYLAASINPLDDGLTEQSTRVFRLSHDGAGTLTFAGIVDISNPVVIEDDAGEGFVAQITAIAEDPEDGTVWVTGFTAPRYGPSYPPNMSPFGDETADLFTVPTLAAIPSGTTWSAGPTGTSVAALPSPLDCLNLALPVSMVVMPSVLPDLDDDGDVDADDLAAFEPCLAGAASAYPGGCSASDFDSDSDVDLDDFALMQRCFSGMDEPADYDCDD